MYLDYIEYIEKLEACIRTYEEVNRELLIIKGELTDTENLRKALYEKYHNKFPYENQEEVREYSREELDEIKRELLDHSIFTIIKRFLGIGKKQDIIYAELMGKIKGLKLYLEGQERDAITALEDAATGIKDLGSIIQTSYADVMEATGIEDEAGWDRYEQSTDDNNVLYFGNIDVFLEEDRETCEKIVSNALGNCYQEDFIKVPYTLENRTPFQFYCEYDGENEQSVVRANGLMRGLLYQQIRQMQEYSVQLHLIDGEKTGNDMSELLGLTQIRESDVYQLNRKVTQGVYKYAQTYLNNQDISEGLKKLDKYIGNVAEETSGFQSIREYNQSETGQEKGLIPLQLLVIQNFPVGFNDTEIELLNKLIKNGEQRGIAVFIQYDRKYREEFRIKVDNPTMNILDGIILEPGSTHIMAKDCSSEIQLKIMEEGKREYIQSLVESRTSIKKVDNRFSALMKTDGPFGQMDATDGIRVPFSVDKKGDIREFTLANALNAHGLISGGTGSGKSTLIHMIISSVAMNYKPEDMEIWLIDYKINEFSSYKSNTPPHIKFLGLSKSMDFTYALLDKIYEEYERRQQVIKRADEEVKQKGERTNITSIKDYRKYFGTERMSRLLIIIDEFHVMAQQVSEDYMYKEKLENLLAEGRAVGITFLFADQAVTVGLKGLTDKGRKQIKCRLAMANDAEEMKEMLSQCSKEEREKLMTMDTGECALVTYETVRAEDGRLVEHPKTERVMNIFLDGETRFELCENIRKYYDSQDFIPVYIDETEKKYYRESEIVQWEKQNLGDVDYTRRIPLYLGEAMDLTGCFVIPLVHRRGENIMSIGGWENEQRQILMSQIRSMQRIPGHEIMILADNYSPLFEMCGDELLDLQEQDDRMKIYSHTEDICREINVLSGKLHDRKNQNRVLVVWIELEDLYEEFQNSSLVKPSCYQNQEKKRRDKALIEDDWSAFFGDDFVPATMDDEPEKDKYEDEELVYNALEDIAVIIQDGPRYGIFNFVVYDTVYPIRNNRMIKIDNFRHKIAFPMGKDECGDYLGRSNLLDGLEKQNGVVAYYDGKGKVKKFIPYQA